MRALARASVGVTLAARESNERKAAKQPLHCLKIISRAPALLDITSGYAVTAFFSATSDCTEV